MAKSSQSSEANARGAVKAAARPPKDGTQEIEDLRKRFENLDKQRTFAQANLQNAQKELEGLKEEALAAYGTDDLEKLQKKLADMKAANEQKRADYQAALDDIEKKLEEVQQRYEQSHQMDEAQP
ncbi:MAG: hypothetical protein L0215_07640 [Gemmataceae bacterium]|nr:hypothetical protein [Gemmataceae bacterium]